MREPLFLPKNKIDFFEIKNNLNKGKMNPNNMIETINGEEEGAVGCSFLGVTKLCAKRKAKLWPRRGQRVSMWKMDPQTVKLIRL